MNKIFLSMINPKLHFYCPDGTGRDRYIVVNNGGNKREQYKQLKKDTRSSKNFAFGHSQKFHSHQISSRISHYFADGSGRDKYIVTNEGGQSFPYKNNQKNDLFLRSLRSYEKLSPLKSNDYFQFGQMQKNIKEIQKDRQVSEQQRTLTERLSSTKRKNMFLQDSPTPTKNDLTAKLPRIQQKSYLIHN